MNHTTDGFINSILNDEDLHLMDMNVNDSKYKIFIFHNFIFYKKNNKFS